LAIILRFPARRGSIRHIVVDMLPGGHSFSRPSRHLHSSDVWSSALVTKEPLTVSLEFESAARGLTSSFLGDSGRPRVACGFCFSFCRSNNGPGSSQCIRSSKSRCSTAPKKYRRIRWSEAFGEEILGRLPNATLRDVHGPHLLLQAKPTECADLILSFVGQCSNAKVW